MPVCLVLATEKGYTRNWNGEQEYASDQIINIRNWQSMRCSVGQHKFLKSCVGSNRVFVCIFFHITIKRVNQ